ncbi:thiamine phosphate synthase [Deferribacteres bacterium DY0037]
MKIMQILDYETFGERFIDIAGQCAPYADVIWFRIKDRALVDEKAGRLREALPDTFLALSLDAQTASKYGYDAVQLGKDSYIESVRRDFPKLRIGYSAHSMDELESKDVDYFTLSPIFFTKKNYEVKPLGTVDVSHIDSEIYALGGISSENINRLKGKGFAGVAGISFYKEIKLLRSQCLLK